MTEHPIDGGRGMTDLAPRPFAHARPATPAPAVPVGHTLGQRSRRDRVVRHAAGAALWLSVLLVTYWWTSRGGFQDLGSWATP